MNARPFDSDAAVGERRLVIRRGGDGMEMVELPSGLQPLEAGGRPFTVVRAEDRTRALPFVMVTAEAKAENVVAARQAGVNNYVIKPFTLAVLKQKLTTVLGEL